MTTSRTAATLLLGTAIALTPAFASAQQPPKPPAAPVVTAPKPPAPTAPVAPKPVAPKPQTAQTPAPPKPVAPKPTAQAPTPPKPEAPKVPAAPKVAAPKPEAPKPAPAPAAAAPAPKTPAAAAPAAKTAVPAAAPAATAPKAPDIKAPEPKTAAPAAPATAPAPAAAAAPASKAPEPKTATPATPPAPTAGKTTDAKTPAAAPGATSAPAAAAAAAPLTPKEAALDKKLTARQDKLTTSRQQAEAARQKFEAQSQSSNPKVKARAEAQLKKLDARLGQINGQLAAIDQRRTTLGAPASPATPAAGATAQPPKVSRKDAKLLDTLATREKNLAEKRGKLSDAKAALASDLTSSDPKTKARAAAKVARLDKQIAGVDAGLAGVNDRRASILPAAAIVGSGAATLVAAISPTSGVVDPAAPTTIPAVDLGGSTGGSPGHNSAEAEKAAAAQAQAQAAALGLPTKSDPGLNTTISPDPGLIIISPSIVLTGSTIIVDNGQFLTLGGQTITLTMDQTGAAGQTKLVAATPNITEPPVEPYRDPLLFPVQQNNNNWVTMGYPVPSDTEGAMAIGGAITLPSASEAAKAWDKKFTADYSKMSVPEIEARIASGGIASKIEANAAKNVLETKKFTSSVADQYATLSISQLQQVVANPDKDGPGATGLAKDIAKLTLIQKKAVEYSGEDGAALAQKFGGGNPVSAKPWETAQAEYAPANMSLEQLAIGRALAGKFPDIATMSQDQRNAEYERGGDPARMAALRASGAYKQPMQFAPIQITYEEPEPRPEHNVFCGGGINLGCLIQPQKPPKELQQAQTIIAGVTMITLGAPLLLVMSLPVVAPTTVTSLGVASLVFAGVTAGTVATGGTVAGGFGALAAATGITGVGIFAGF